MNEHLIDSGLMQATITNSAGWNNWWFEGRDGETIIVRKYQYKTTRSGKSTYCSCVDCVIENAGKELYDAWEVIPTGSIIPECCLQF